MNARRLLGIITAFALLSPATVVRTEGGQHLGHENRHHNGPVAEAVREATERFRNLNVAIAEGYVQNGGCVSGPDQGAMGVHFVKFSLFDDVIDVDAAGSAGLRTAKRRTPSGRRRIHHAGRSLGSDARRFRLPHLMGHLFHYAPGPNRYGPPAFYELHVWAWKDNPKGTFTDWNSKVSCEDWP